MRGLFALLVVSASHSRNLRADFQEVIEAEAIIEGPSPELLFMVEQQHQMIQQQQLHQQQLHQLVQDDLQRLEQMDERLGQLNEQSEDSRAILEQLKQITKTMNSMQQGADKQMLKQSGELEGLDELMRTMGEHRKGLRSDPMSWSHH
jgi:vacuolar-type H+-ATPase subunit I/STV1